MENKRIVERAEKALQRHLDWVGRHDTRSNAYFTIGIAMMGALSLILPHPTKITTPLGVALVLCAVGFVICFANLIQGQFPRLESPNTSLLFFGTIAPMDLGKFKEKFRGLTEDQYIDDLLDQAHINAKVMAVKFRHLRRALMAIIFTTPPWLAAIYLCRDLIIAEVAK